MKIVYIVGGAIAVIAWLAVGLLVAKGPQPEIIVPAEKLWTLGPLNITNSLLTAWVVMAFLIIFTFLATRTMRIIPSGAQNFVEATVGYLVDQVEDIAGEKNGRKFFIVVATIFIFIITSNWFGLLPFFNAIGQVHDVNHEILAQISEHQADGTNFDEQKKFGAWKMENSSGITLVKPGGKSVEFEVHKDETPANAIDRYIVFLAHEFTGFQAHEDEATAAAPSAEEVKAAREALDKDPGAPKIVLSSANASGGVEPIKSPGLGEELTGVNFPGKNLSLVVPFFRSPFSDVNNTLAMGVVAFIVVEFWGFQALGFGYLRKFFNLNGVNAFVGILELISEFIRIISFAFRLFGNIFAGEVLILMLTFLMPFLFVDIIYGLELFVGFIQAAVFALLTLVFAVSAVEAHGEEHEEGGHHETPEHGAVQAH